MDKNEKIEMVRNYISSLHEKQHKSYTNQIRGIIYNIKRVHNLSNQDVADILLVSENLIENILNENWNGHISTKLAIKLFIMSEGLFEMPGCKLPDDSKKKMSELLDCINKEESLNEDMTDEDELPLDDNPLNTFLEMLGVKSFMDGDLYSNAIEKIQQAKEMAEAEAEKLKKRVEFYQKLNNARKTVTNIKDTVSEKLDEFRNTTTGTQKQAKDENKQPEEKKPLKLRFTSIDKNGNKHTEEVDFNDLTNFISSIFKAD